MTAVAIAELAKVLQLYGGWGMTAVLIAALLWFYKHTSKLLDERNNRFIELLRECSVALTNAEQAINQIRTEAKADLKENGNRIDKLEDKLEVWVSEHKVLLDANRTLMSKVDSKL